MRVSDPAGLPLEQWRPGVETRMVVSGLVGARQLCIFEQVCAPGSGAPTHSHAVEEVLTVLAGVAEIWLGDERAGVASGQSVVVPAGMPHGFRNTGAGALHVHAVLASASFEAVFEGSAEPRRRWVKSGPDLVDGGPAELE